MSCGERLKEVRVVSSAICHGARAASGVSVEEVRGEEREGGSSSSSVSTPKARLCDFLSASTLHQSSQTSSLVTVRGQSGAVSSERARRPAKKKEGANWRLSSAVCSRSSRDRVVAAFRRRRANKSERHMPRSHPSKPLKIPTLSARRSPLVRSSASRTVEVAPAVCKSEVNGGEAKFLGELIFFSPLSLASQARSLSLSSRCSCSKKNEQ